MVTTPLLARRYGKYWAGGRRPIAHPTPGEGSAPAFVAWVEPSWGDDAPPAPAARPAAVSAGHPRQGEGGGWR